VIQVAEDADDRLPTIGGLQYFRQYLSQETHDRLLAAVDAHLWQQSVDHGVQVYGYHYNHRKGAAYRIGELPPWAHELAMRLWADGLVPGLPNQMVANDYPPGAGIFAHIDQAVFGDTVASVSLGSTCLMRFWDGGSERSEECLLEPRSVLILSGEARWRWKHEIPAQGVDTWRNQDRARSRRVSLTFRMVPAPDGSSPRLERMQTGAPAGDARSSDCLHRVADRQ
jgi:alkylated DNA repair dioxygenase AlkB